MELTPEQLLVLEEVNAKSQGMIRIPSRKSEQMTSELWEKRKILKELTYKGLIQWDVDFGSKELVFFPNLIK